MISELISLRVLRIEAAVSAQLEIREQGGNNYKTWHELFRRFRAYVLCPNWHHNVETLTIFSHQLKRPLTFREIGAKILHHHFSKQLPYCCVIPGTAARCVISAERAPPVFFYSCWYDTKPNKGLLVDAAQCVLLLVPVAPGGKTKPS